ncbi:multiple epidermal growth factor-like domains protein 10 [Mercenaria mercenaria]|uniref:multiple epidermal growth factor-like domains protein 10 n=1 Tax=Mercenaria mercenaria TaxID=6596 RepID=UPI00234E5318|nr:multiple epidermal growth factor-like domains protein 10 [Mercenaria mercenaria]
MHCISTAILLLWVCESIIVSDSQTAEEGVIDCTVGCACCKNQRCGPIGYFPEGNCYDGCIDGYRSARCYQKCTYNCTKCAADINTCTECFNGYFPGPSSDCTAKCLPGCETCTSNTACTKCKDEYYNANGFTDCRYRYCPKNCVCQQSLCISCKTGYYDISASCSGICRGNCVTCSSRDTCDVCKDGYFNGHQFDIINRPLLTNCTLECRDNCERCSSYNTCLQCKTGRYGPTCQEECSIGCEKNECLIDTGNCNCSPNFSGDKCDQCQIGKHGNLCEKQCSLGCKANVCHKESGECLDGCIVDTIIGKTCNECSTGMYGAFCNKTCPSGCKDGKCERDTGECSLGCIHNFNGIRCEHCIDGKYGESCGLDCPDNCATNICVRDSGDCLQCMRNYSGHKCEDCEQGLYGSTCSDTCPSQCLNDTCSRTVGTCTHGCIENYSGDRCCVQNINCVHCLSNTKCKKCISGYYNELCDELCPHNCVDSCDIETGSCHSCKNNFYGLFCNLSCSSICIDNVCNQGNGKCTRGCNGTADDPVCPQRSDSPEETESVIIIAAVLGSILAVSVVVNIAFVGRVLIKKIHTSRRKPVVQKAEEAFYENTGIAGNYAIEMAGNNETNGNDGTVTEQASLSVCISKKSEYEDIRNVQDSEHEYGHIAPAATN